MFNVFVSYICILFYITEVENVVKPRIEISPEEKYLKELIKYAIYNKKLLENIEKRIDILVNDIEDIKRDRLNKQVCTENENIPIYELYSTLPIQSFQEIENISEQLGEAENFKALVISYLTHIHLFHV